jgi:RNA polymerase II subunit A C-terminal domain phosphatase SSU72
MEGHRVLLQAGFDVTSYGTGTQVKLPGPSADKPNVYDFGTPYTEILADLRSKDEQLYIENRMIGILERNVKIKKAPERWQDEHAMQFDVILTFEERVYDAVLDDFQKRQDEAIDAVDGPAVHVINIETKDTPSESIIGMCRPPPISLPLPLLLLNPARPRT